MALTDDQLHDLAAELYAAAHGLDVADLDLDDRNYADAALNGLLRDAIGKATSAIPKAVLDFINDRTNVIVAMQNAPASAVADYCRWSGHAEARRLLAGSLGLTVPHNVGDKAEPVKQ